MYEVERSLPTFEGLMEVIETIMKNNPKSRIYLEKEVVEAANEAGLLELTEKGINKTPILIAEKSEKGMLLSSIIVACKERKFDLEGEPYWECNLALDFVMEY